MSIQVGQKAPLFSLYNSEKKLINLEDFIGKKNVLLLFYPQAFTGVCTTELCGIRDSIGNYENDNIQVLGISVDSVFTLAKFKEEQRYNFPLLSDFNRDASEKYKVLYDSFTDMGMKGVSKRSAFLIDKQGIIQYAVVFENAGQMPDFNEIDSHIVHLSN